ncbi:hypothetical protein Tco_1152448, partial [Tanacetum coccineum]
ANVVRFDRSAKPANKTIRTETPAVNTYASVHKGEAKQFMSIQKLPTILSKEDADDNKKVEDKVSSPYVGFNSHIIADSSPIEDQMSSHGVQYSHMNDNKKGGSILEVMDDMIKVGQTMGYTMEGCMKDLENIIGTQGVNDLEDRNDMVRFKKKLQGLKKAIREWVTDRKKNHNLFIKDTKLKFGDIDKKLDCGEASDELLLLRMNLMQSL